MKLSKTYLRVSAIGALALGLAVVTTTLAAGQPGPWFALGQAIDRASAVPSDVVATVDGAMITRRDIARARALIQLNNATSPNKANDTDRAALQFRLRFLALSEEAFRRGLRPTPGETQKFIADVRATFAAVPEAQKQLTELLAGLGQTEEQFFGSAEAAEDYERQLAISRLLPTVVGTKVGQERITLSDAFAEATLAKARVVVLDPTLR